MIKAEPLPVYRVVRERREVTRFDAARERGLTALAGRDDELALLDASLRASPEGGGQIAAVAWVRADRPAVDLRILVDR